MAHNRSDLQRENQPKLADFKNFREEFDDLEKELRDARKAAQSERSTRKKAKVIARAAW